MKKILTAVAMLNVMILLVFAGLSSADDSLYVDPSGNVGIGTDSPQSKFHVSTGEVRLDRDAEDPTIFNDAANGWNYIRGVTVTNHVLGVLMTPVPGYAVDVYGYVRGVNFIAWSDADIKEDIQPVENSLDRLSRLQGVSYELKDGPDKTKRRHLGVIAQEVEQEFPEVVFTDENGKKAVAYQGLIAPLIESAKFLKAENESNQLRIKSLEEKNRVLEERIAALEKVLAVRAE